MATHVEHGRADARLGGKTAVVTGAGSGIGRAIALLFARTGARVLCADVALETAEATASLIMDARGTADAAPCDVRDEEQVARLMHTAVDQYGALDVLVNNAGINPLAQHPDDVHPDLWGRVLDVNLAGIFWGCKHGAAAMRKHGHGHGSIVNLASVSGLIGWGGSAAYIASKGGVIALTRKLAIDYAPHGIRVNCLCPGSIRTPMVEQKTESRWVAQQLGRPVIKAFNNIYAEHLLERGQPAGTPGRIALPVAGDNAAAKAVVLRLVDELGFDGVDAGGLDESWRQQPGTPVYATDLDAEGVRRALAEARPERQPEFRATPNSPGTFVAPA